MTSTTALELAPIPIGDPYPVPAVATVSIQRRLVQPVGITVRLAGKNSVMVQALTADSLLHGTSIRVGLEILAINGEAVHRTGQATRLIKNHTDVEFTTFDPAANQTPFCYIEVAPTSKSNPGVSFNSCCARSMVVISDVFVSLAKTRLRAGDIVLAVNGVPVWKPEQADREQLAAARASKALVLYCVDMEALRDFFAARTQRKHLDGRTALIQKQSRLHFKIKERDCVCTAKINKETLLLDDETEWEHRVKTSGANHYSDAKNLRKKTSYSQVCAPALASFNELILSQLQRLKAKVVAHAWTYAVECNEGDNTFSSYAVPSAPAAPVEITSSSDMFGNDSNIPLATAVLAIEDGEDETNGTAVSL